MPFDVHLKNIHGAAIKIDIVDANKASTKEACKIPRREQTSNPLRKPSICEGMDQSLRMTAEDVMLEGLGASSSVGV